MRFLRGGLDKTEKIFGESAAISAHLNGAVVLTLLSAGAEYYDASKIA